jgi:peroxiredoxin
MAYTESTMLPLGTQAPDFSLPDTVSGRMVSLKEVAGPEGTVVMFLCNHCPYVLHVNAEIVRIAHEFGPLGLGFVGISSNDAGAYPEDGPERMREQAREVGYPFPYLYDETQEVARAYDAACTPDFYVFDAGLRLVYRGQLDDSRPKRNPVPVTGTDLRAALEDVLAHRPPTERQRPSGGCNIKWRAVSGER